MRIDGYLEIEKLSALTGDHPKYIGWVPVTRVLAEKEHDRYLRRKEKVGIENRIELRRTLLNAYPYAFSKIAKDVLKLIKNAPTADD